MDVLTVLSGSTLYACKLVKWQFSSFDIHIQARYSTFTHSGTDTYSGEQGKAFMAGAVYT